MEIKALETPLNCSYGLSRYRPTILDCIDLLKHLKDEDLIMSLLDVMLTRVDNNGLPGGRIYSPIVPKELILKLSKGLFCIHSAIYRYR